MESNNLISFPKALIVLPVFNEERFIASTIQNLTISNYPNFEILIIDDGSTDATANIIKNHFFKNIIYKYQENQGPSSAMNVAIDYAIEHNFEFISRCDADDISHPDRIKKQINILLSDANYAACGSNCNYIGENSENIIGNSTVSIFPKLVHIEIQLGLRGIIQGCTTFRTSALEEIGGYNSELRQAEDTDLFLRLSENYQLTNIPDFLYTIRYRNTSLSNKDIYNTSLNYIFARKLSKLRKKGIPIISKSHFESHLSFIDKFNIFVESNFLRQRKKYLTSRNPLFLFFAIFLSPKRIVFRLIRRLSYLLFHSF